MSKITLEAKDVPAVRDAYYREYDTLRQESLQSMGNRTQIIAFGLGTIGVLIAATLTMPNPPSEFVWVMFNYAVPSVSALVYVAWFAEFERMVRAGRYIQKLEEAINATLAHPALSWERDLENMRMGYAYAVVALLFLGLAMGSPVLAFLLQDTTQRSLTAVQWLSLPSNFADLWSTPYPLTTPWPAWLLAVLVAGLSALRIKRRFSGFNKSVPAPIVRRDASPKQPTESEIPPLV